MNKIITLLLLFFCALSALAQDDSSKKPAAKNLTAEVNFDPFSSSPISINYLRLRTFTSEKSAIRLGFSLGFENANPSKDEKASTFEWNLRPGYEWHLSGTERLSPYFGAELDIAIKTSRFESDETGNSYTIEGAWSTTGFERGFTRIGANLIAGVDIYVIKKLYLGTEIGFGFEKVKLSDIKVNNPVGTDPSPIEGGKSFQIGPNFNSSLRLGFVF